MLKLMESVKRNSNILSSLDKLCSSIIKEFITLMKDTEAEDNTVYEVLGEKYPDKDRSEFESLVQDIGLKLIADSETVKRELPEFSRFISREVDSLDEISAPFLVQVWSGDVYDCGKTSAMSELHKELQSQFDLLNDDDLERMALERLE